MSTGKKVMIVEDSQTERYEVKMIIGKLGVGVVEAANELGMFNSIEEYGQCVDLIIMDLSLKNENGLELIEKLKQSKKYSSIPILILTEYADKGNVLRARELGVIGFLKKPIQKDELLDRVKTVLQIL